MSSLKKGGNCIERIEEAIDYVSNRLSVEDSPIRHPTSMDTVNGNLVSQDQLNSSTSNQPVQRHAPDPDLKLNNASERSETQLPSNLITHCVSTLLMIQVLFPLFMYLFIFYIQIFLNIITFAWSFSPRTIFYTP